MTSIFKNFLSDYRSDTRGNFGMMMAAAVMVIMIGVGAAVDFSGMSTKQQKFQSLADMAVLAAAASGKQEQGQLLQIARDIVEQNNFTGDTLTTQLVITENNTIRVSVNGNYQMSLMGMFGYNQSEIGVMAEAPPKGGGKLNLALVLDTTGSMDGSKISALRSAADTLVTDLNTGVPGDLMVSVVPFSQYVKIPTSFLGSTWLEVEPTSEHCWMSLDKDASTGCDDDDEKDKCDVEVYVETCKILAWSGCVGSRADPWHKRDYYGGTKLQGFAGGGSCHSEILPLTTDISAVKSNIAGLLADESTYIPAGLTWGWRTLSPEEPLTEANTIDKDARNKALLLMTDGKNTRSYGGTNTTYNGVFHWEENQADADSLTAELCADIKNDDITIYSIAFEVTDATTISMLKNCASDAGKFFDAGDASALQSAFDGIGEELARVRLSR